MTDLQPGPDELRVRGILRKAGVGPDAEEQPLPPMPTHRPHGFPPRPRDWLDDILDDETHQPPPAPPADSPAAEENNPAPQPAPKRPWTGRRILPVQTPTRRTRDPEQHPATADPRRSLLDALDAVPHRIRRLLTNLTAAGLGWSLGWVHFAQDVVAWIHARGLTDPQSIFWFAVGLGCLALARRGRPCWWPVAWLATVPAASAIAGVLLYAPTA